MARVFGPLHSDGASGTVAKSSVFAKWNGRSYVRGWVIPSNPKTADQMANRANLGGAGKITKVGNAKSTIVTFLKGKKSSDQSWNSYLASQMIGSGGANASAARTAYVLSANSTVKGYFDDQATTSGIESVSLGTTDAEKCPGGLALWMFYAALNRLGQTDASADVTDVTSAELVSLMADYTVAAS